MLSFFTKKQEPEVATPDQEPEAQEEQAEAQDSTKVVTATLVVTSNGDQDGIVVEEQQCADATALEDDYANDDFEFNVEKDEEQPQPEEPKKEEVPVTAAEEDAFDYDFEADEEEQQHKPDTTEPVVAALKEEEQQHSPPSIKAVEAEAEDEYSAEKDSFESEEGPTIALAASSPSNTQQEQEQEVLDKPLKKQETTEEPDYSLDNDFETEQHKRPTVSVDEYSFDDFEADSDNATAAGTLGRTSPGFDDGDLVKTSLARSQDLFGDILKKPTLKHVSQNYVYFVVRGMDQRSVLLTDPNRFHCMSYR